MRTFPFITLLCFSLLLLLPLASAQQPTPEEVQREVESMLRWLPSPQNQLKIEGERIGMSRSTWTGQGTGMLLRGVMQMGGETELGWSEEQKQRLSFLLDDHIGNLMMRMQENPTPEFTQRMTQVREAMRAVELPDDPFYERATEEQRNAYREASIMSSSLLFMGTVQSEIEETLTPAQMREVRKLEMQLSPVVGIPFPAMYEPLDLTDEQKAEMNKIADEIRIEFDRLALEEAQFTAQRMVAVLRSELFQGKTFASPEDVENSIHEYHRQYVPSEEERKKYKEFQERGIKMVTLLQNRLMNVLTDEQLDKMQKILEESPEFVKKILAEFKTEREAQKKSPTYVPGPDSWRPGDPLPVQFKEERRTRGFPRSE